MRTDFTISDGREDIDYRISAPSDLHWSELADAFVAAGLDRALLAETSGQRPLTGDRIGVPANPAGPRGRVLHVVGGQLSGAVFALRPGSNSVGRHPDCAVVLADPDVGGHQCDIELGARGLRVVPSDPSTEYLINSADSTGIRELAAGDRVQFGATVLLVDGPGPVDPGLPPEIIDMPSAPRSGRNTLTTLALVIPSLGGLAAFASVGSRHGSLFAVVGVAAVMCALVAARTVGGGRSARRRHRVAVAQAHAAIAAAHAAEAAQRRAASPAPHTLGSATPSGSRACRVGIGHVLARTAARRDGELTRSDLRDVPICVEVSPPGLGFEAPAPVARGQARWLLCQLVAQVVSSQLAVDLELDSRSERDWHWARWLPHLRRVWVDGELMTGPPDARPDGDRAVVVVRDSHGSEPSSTPADAIVLTVGCGSPVVTLAPVDDTGARQVLRRAGVAPTPMLVDAVTEEWADRFARSLPESAAGRLPLGEDVRLLDLLGLQRSPDRAEILRRWSRAELAARVPLGLAIEGVITFDLDADGPHALIGGTTGSGKSALLQTLVFGLAAQLPPQALQFLLVDYKGGAAFGACRDLPHTAGVVTDLDAALTARALRSLAAELRRRERILADAGCPDFGSLLRSSGECVLARLVIVVDEFATLAAELPEFVSGLVSIAQRGRSLGMHLVLATQRPGGAVSPDIRANTNLRIALRTVSPAESMDLIDRPDAAKLDPAVPGRAVRAGAAPDTFQVARLGPGRGADVATVSALGTWRRPLAPKVTADRPDEATLLATAIKSAAESCAAPPSPPWLGALPELLDADTLPTSGCEVALGVVDLPDEQRQDLLRLNLTLGGCIAVAGSARSGRSSVLITLATSAAAGLGPTELEIHVLDFSAGGLSALRGLAHVGTHATGSDPIAFACALIAALARLVDERRARQETSRRAVLVLIDDWAALCAAADNHDLGLTTTRLLALLSGARAAGITVVVTGDRSVLGQGIVAVADHRYVLRCADPADYQLAGLPAAHIPRHLPPGRGLRIPDAAELQFAYRAKVSHPPAQPAPGTLRLKALPTLLDPAVRELREGHAHLGLGGDEGAPLWLAWAEVFQLLVAGPRRSGKTGLLASMINQADGCELAVATAPGSILRRCAAAESIHWLAADQLPELAPHTVVLVDDVEQYADTALEGALLGWTRAGGRIVVVGSSDRLSSMFRGLGAEARRWHRGIVLQPSIVDGELLGVKLARTELGGPVGRGIAVGEPAWQWPTTPDQTGRCSTQTWAPP